MTDVSHEAEDDDVECPECGFTAPPRIIDYYDTNLPACRGCGVVFDHLVDDEEGDP